MASDPHARLAPLAHGGDLALARRLFPGAPEPFVDLSTGINPFAYRLPQLSSDAFLRLPDPSAVQRLAAAAAEAYGAPSLACVVPAPGSQILLPMVAGLVPKGRAGVLAPGYAENARAAALAGHTVIEAKSVDEITACDLAIISNPNNPDGRTFPRASLLALATELERRHGLLVVDEAFMDIGPADASLAGDTDRPNIVVLRSFGKFFGLPGVRLGFALANPRTAAELAARLGPWAVSGPAIAIGEVALADRIWAITTRVDLAAEAIRLDQILIRAELEVAGGTSLFRLVVSNYAPRIFDHLGRAGIFVRRFARYPTWLRFGLPGNEEAWQRLRGAFEPGTPG